MDESYLTGEPYVLSKAVGAGVLSGAINGEGALTIRAERRPVDSRYAKIMQVMRDSEQRRPQLRRLGDQLGAVYTPVAVAIAVAAWAISGEPLRFLAVLVVATPCPLLIGIPVAIIGSISLAARRGIVIKDPGGAREGRHLPHRDLRQDRARSPTASRACPRWSRPEGTRVTACWPWSPASSGTRGIRSPPR